MSVRNDLASKKKRYNPLPPAEFRVSQKSRSQAGSQQSATPRQSGGAFDEKVVRSTSARAHRSAPRFVIAGKKTAPALSRTASAAGVGNGRQGGTGRGPPASRLNNH
jgi:hypothetical protein